MAAYIGHRPDIIEFLDALRTHFEVSLFVLESDANMYRTLLARHNKVIINIQSQHTIRNRIAKYLFDYAGKIPESKYNYYMTRWTSTFSSTYSPAQRIRLQNDLRISKRIPKVISYDNFLTSLDASSINTTAYDAFLSFTPVYNHVVWSAMLNSKVPCFQYVYSWDHACKFKDFSKRVRRYLTWDDDIARDLTQLQYISTNRCLAVGSSQFALVYNYLASEYTCRLPTDKPYVYLGCATGYPKLAKAEVRCILQLATAMAQIVPDLRLVVRTYPFLESGDTYIPLKSCSNVILDQLKDYKQIAGSYKESSYRKLYITQHAQAFIHFGTTLGIEAALVSTPSILCDFGSSTVGAELHDFVHQYQNDKYLNREGSHSTARSIGELLNTIVSITSDQSVTFQVNEEISRRTTLKSFGQIAADLKRVVASEVDKP